MNYTKYKEEQISSSEKVMFVIEREADDNLEREARMDGGWNVSRRSFLKGLAAGGLAVVVLGNFTPVALGQDHTGGEEKQLSEEVNSWLRIEDDSTITAFSPKVEYGQGIRMGFKMIVAEEMDISPDRVELVMGDTGRVEEDPTTGTWGSQSTITMYPYLRKAAALARQTLLRLAAKEFDEKQENLEIRDGAVGVSGQENQEISFGDLVEGSIPSDAVPSEPEYRSSSSYEHVGKDRTKDVKAKVTGERTFGSDVLLDNMAYGAVLRDEPSGKMDQFDDEKALKRDGVIDVVRENSYLVVVAERTDIARNAIRDQVDGPWPGPDEHSDDMREYLLDNAGDKNIQSRRGSVKSGLEKADETIEVQYYLPYIQHSPIEPETATARWNDNELEVWTGTQAPFLVKKKLARKFGLGEDEVRVRVPDIGGAFGGKSSATVQEEAATAAREMERPVQIQWTREEQFAFKYTRPAALVNVKAGVTEDGTITAWDYHAIGQGLRGTDLPYEAENVRVAKSDVSHVLDTGAWRGVSGPPNCWALESAIDELAAAIDSDPAKFRLENMKRSRSRKVLKTAMNEFGWEKASTEDNEGLGIAFGVDVGSEIAEIVQLNVEDEEPPQVSVESVTVSIDPGLAVNPEGIRLQMEGGVIMGLSSALYEKLEFGDGELESTLFDSYPIAEFQDVPEVETHIVDTGMDKPQGVGEPPIFPISPAIFNAYHDATGTRKRSLPLCRE